ncbi:MAG: phosphatase PAP2 family protein [Candidatus Methanomethylophilaceae archaeon]|nr:undecaprenyl-diphosphatase [Candidatus Methanomethylophilaceae archaeon]
MGLDMEVLTWIHGNLSSGAMDTVMKCISCSGDYAAVWVGISAVLLICRPTRKIGAVMAAAVLLGLVLNDLMIKPLIERPRPFIEDPSLLLVIDPPDGYSFASGHTSRAFAAAFALFIYNRKWGAVLLAYAALMGFSRVYLMVHYPSDVIAGALIGIICAVTACKIVEYIKKKYGCPGTDAGE